MLQLKKFPNIPVSTREEARESRPHPEEPCFRLQAREEGSFICLVGKEFPAFPSHLKRRRSPQERREKLQSRATIPRVPQMSQSIPGKTVFPALPRLSSRGSTHTMVARPWSSSRLSRGDRFLLKCDGNVGNSFPITQGKDPSSRARRRKRGSSGCGRDSHASSRVETGMSGNFLSCRKGVKDPLEVPDVRCD